MFTFFSVNVSEAFMTVRVNPLMPGDNKRSYIKAAGFFKYISPFDTTGD